MPDPYDALIWSETGEQLACPDCGIPFAEGEQVAYDLTFVPALGEDREVAYCIRPECVRSGDPLAYPDPSWGKVERGDAHITITTPAIRFQ